MSLSRAMCCCRVIHESVGPSCGSDASDFTLGLSGSRLVVYAGQCSYSLFEFDGGHIPAYQWYYSAVTYRASSTTGGYAVLLLCVTQTLTQRHCHVVLVP